jgi:hypothetical protein
MKSRPVDIILSERLWWEELGHQDLPQELICLLRDLISNIDEGTPVLETWKVKDMVKKELNYIIIGSDVYIVSTRRYIEGNHLFFLSAV